MVGRKSEAPSDVRYLTPYAYWSIRTNVGRRFAFPTYKCPRAGSPIKRRSTDHASGDQRIHSACEQCFCRTPFHAPRRKSTEGSAKHPLGTVSRTPKHRDRSSSACGRMMGSTGQNGVHADTPGLSAGLPVLASAVIPFHTTHGKPASCRDAGKLNHGLRGVAHRHSDFASAT